MKYSIIYRLKPGYTSFPNSREGKIEWRGQVDSPVCGVLMHSACIELSAVARELCMVACSPENFGKCLSQD